MKQRIANKKLKKDILINLWIKEWRYSINNVNNILSSVTKNNYEDHNSIWYCRFKICRWLMDYEFKQIVKIGNKKYSFKNKQIYDYLLKRNLVTFKYKSLGKLVLK